MSGLTHTQTHSSGRLLKHTSIHRSMPIHSLLLHNVSIPFPPLSRFFFLQPPLFPQLTSVRRSWQLHSVLPLVPSLPLPYLFILAICRVSPFSFALQPMPLLQFLSSLHSTNKPFFVTYTFLSLFFAFSYQHGTDNGSFRCFLSLCKFCRLAAYEARLAERDVMLSNTEEARDMVQRELNTCIVSRVVRCCFFVCWI